MEAADAGVLALGALFGAVCAGMGLVVLAAAPRRPLNRWLCAFLVLSGIVTATAFHGAFLRDRFLAYNAIAWNNAVWWPAMASYLLFVGLAVRSPIARPFAWRPVRVALPVLTVALGILVLARHEWFFAPPVALPDGRWSVPYRDAFIGPAAIVPLLTFVVPLAAGLDAWRRAPRGSAQRDRARAYAAAFGVQDAGYAILVTLMNVPGMPLEVVRGVIVASQVFLILVLALLARALLRHQLFDFDLKVKRGIATGTVAAAFVAVFFVVSEGAQALLSERFGPVVGLVAAGLLVFLLTPLQRVGERVADAAMPRVAPTPEYLAYRKLQVYRATLEGAYADGEVTARERVMLERLRTELRIAEEDAAAIERDVHGAPPGGVPAEG